MSSTSDGWVLGSSAAVVIARHLVQMMSLIVAQYSPDRNVPHADCCIHPPGRNEMIAITPPKIFSKEVAQNRPPHLPRRQPPSAPEIVLRQISGDGAWMNFRFSRALPPRGGSHTPALTI